MKVIKSYWKSCLCFLLAFLCIIAVVFASKHLLGAEKLNGGGYPRVTPADITNASAGGAEGTTTLHAYRMSLIGIDSDGDNNGWAYIDGNNVLHTDLSSGKTGYNNDNWFYFIFNEGWAKTDVTHHTWFLNSDASEILDVGNNKIIDIDVGEGYKGVDDSVLESIFNNLGVSNYESEEDFMKNLDSCILDVDLDGDTAKYLKNIFGVSDDRWIIVIESLQAYGYGKSEGSDSGYPNFIWYGHTGQAHDLGPFGGWFSEDTTSTTVTDKGWAGYGTIGGVDFEQERNMWGSSDFDSVNGYVVYGALYGTGSKSLANISVTYTGAPNTSDHNKFNSAGTVGGYFDGSLKSWNYDGDTWDSEFNLNMSTVDTDYTLMFTGATKLVASKDVDVSEIVKQGNDMGGFNLGWKTSEVNGDIHAGVTSRVSLVNGVASTLAISNQATVVDGISPGGAKDDFWDCTGNDHPSGGNIENSIRATYTQAANWYSSDKAITKKGVFKKGETLGLGTEFIAKGQPVTSTHYIITLNPNGSSVTSEELKYTTNTAGSTVTKDNAIALVVAPKFDGNTNPDYVRSGLNADMSSSEVLSSLTSRIRDSKASTIDASSRNVTVGHDASNNNNGYVIYEVVSSNIEGLYAVRGTTELEDWFLNKYTNNILETAYKEANQNRPFHFGINYSHTIDTSGATYEDATCGERLLTGLGSNYTDYRISYSMNRSGTEVSWDSSRQKIYYPASANSTFNGSDSIYKFPVTINTLTYSGNRNIDYAFNFVRSAVGDVRSVSGISYTSYSDIGDSTNMLRIADAFGVVPTRVVTRDAGRRQLAGVTEETFTFDSIFTKTNNVWGLKEGYTAIHKDGKDHEYGNGKEVTDNVTGAKYIIPNVCTARQYLTDPTSSKNVGLVLNVSALHSLTYKLTGNAYKYQAVSLSEGKNSLLGNSSAVGVATSANKPTGVTKKDTNEYRFATVNRNSNVNLNFYPENYMVCKIGGTVFDSAPYQYVSVISEVKRQAESSSLYLIKVNTDITDDSTITGSTYSDTMQGGTSSVTNSKVSIPAGSDVTVLADTSNIKIDLYGYALDLIDKSKDSSMKIGASSSKSYNSVVKSGADLISAWGNDGSHAETLKSNFTTWADNVMKLENFGADFTLDVNNNTKGANFGATIGKVNHTSGSVEDGVYNIVIENGAIVESDGAYQQMITQLAADYECSYDEANALFKDSQIYTSILNAIESSTSNFNTSGRATGVADSWTSTLGNDNNWYDEKVRTFVVRRYTNLGNTLSDITATDKLDYSLAPTGSNSGKENASAGTTYDAKWSLNLFFNSAKKAELDSLIFENGNYFDPSSNTDITGANNAYTILINKTPVKNADFLIPASSTSNFGF